MFIKLFCVSDIISVPFITQRLDISRKAVEVFVRNALALADNGHKALSHALAALLAFGEAEALVMRIPCAS